MVGWALKLGLMNDFSLSGEEKGNLNFIYLVAEGILLSENSKTLRNHRKAIKPSDYATWSKRSQKSWRHRINKRSTKKCIEWRNRLVKLRRILENSFLAAADMERKELIVCRSQQGWMEGSGWNKTDLDMCSEEYWYWQDIANTVYEFQCMLYDSIGYRPPFDYSRWKIDDLIDYLFKEILDWTKEDFNSFLMAGPFWCIPVGLDDNLYTKVVYSIGIQCIVDELDRRNLFENKPESLSLKYITQG